MNTNSLFTINFSSGSTSFALSLLSFAPAAFVAVIAFFQWKTSRDKFVFDLFDRRYKLYRDVITLIDEVDFENKDSLSFVVKRLHEIYWEAGFLFGRDFTDVILEYYDAYRHVLKDKNNTIPIFSELSRMVIRENLKIADNLKSEVRNKFSSSSRRYLQRSDTVKLPFLKASSIKYFINNARYKLYPAAKEYMRKLLGGIIKPPPS
ncbi:MAG: hypothetical protein H6R00_1870 [Proteobacteria bacterium]|nr:hypothetical protein [Pseudomonadota bacterium]